VTVIPDPLITIEIRAESPPYERQMGVDMTGQILVAGNVVWETETEFAKGIPDEPERVERLLRTKCEVRLGDALAILLRMPEPL
jgi:hypothetical protein